MVASDLKKRTLEVERLRPAHDYSFRVRAVLWGQKQKRDKDAITKPVRTRGAPPSAPNKMPTCEQFVPTPVAAGGIERAIMGRRVEVVRRAPFLCSSPARLSSERRRGRAGWQA